MKQYSIHVFGFLLFCISLGACEDTLEQSKKIQPYEGPVSTIFEVETLFSDSAKLKIKLNAPLQLEYQNEDRSFPKGVMINFYNAKGQNHAQLTANKGRFIKKENRYEATGNVVVKNLLKKEQLNTEKLNWTPANQTIFTDEFVTITTKKEILKGNGLEARQDFSQYKILKPTGEFVIKQ